MTNMVMGNLMPVPKTRTSSTNGDLNLNVGGMRKTVERSLVGRFPQTRLGRLLTCETEESILLLCDDYDVAAKEFYFDRSPKMFCYILNFYYTKHLHFVEELCVLSFSQEIDYWGIHEVFIAPCCKYQFHLRKEAFLNTQDDDDDADDFASVPSLQDILLLQKDMDTFNSMVFGKHRRRVWLLLDNPDYSLRAKVFAFTSILIVLVSIGTICVNSMKDFNRLDDRGNEIEDPTVTVLENFCIIWFTTEFLVRLLVAPQISRFLQNPLNIIDLISILPFYVMLAIDLALHSGDEFQDIGRVVQVLRLSRIFRTLKLARHSPGLRTLGVTLTHSYHEVGLLLIFLAMGIAIFSVFTFAVEHDVPESKLHSIPICWWWATITLTTVGYGDVVPIALSGKLVATFCIICGLVTVALPITVIFNNFTKYYQRQKVMDRLFLSGKSTLPSLESINICNTRPHSMQFELHSAESSSGNSSGNDRGSFGGLQKL